MPHLTARLALAPLAALLIGLGGVHAQPASGEPHAPLTVYNVNDKIGAYEARADRLRAVRRGEAVAELRALRGRLDALKKRGAVTDADLEPLNDALEAWVVRYNMKPLPLQT